MFLMVKVDLVVRNAQVFTGGSSSLAALPLRMALSLRFAETSFFLTQKQLSIRKQSCTSRVVDYVHVRDPDIPERGNF